MGLLSQYQQLSTDAATVTADQTKLSTDQAAQATDVSAFVAALGAGAAFVSSDGKSVDIVVPAPSASPPYTVTTFPVAS